jgi:hypothetical protein
MAVNSTGPSRISSLRAQVVVPDDGEPFIAVDLSNIKVIPPRCWTCFVHTSRSAAPDLAWAVLALVAEHIIQNSGSKVFN